MREATSAGVTTHYAYDDLDRITAKLTALPDGSSHSVLYDYNAAGQKTSVRYLRAEPGDRTAAPVRSTRYRYDALGRMTRVDIDKRPGVIYEYDTRTLRLARKHLASGETLAYRYDDQGWTTLMEVTDDEGELVGRIGYEWSSDGRLARRIREGYAAEKSDGGAPMLASVGAADGGARGGEWFRIVQNYEYNPLGRLVAVTSPEHPELNETYAYDASGNITEKEIAGVRSTFDYDLANQLKVSHIGSETTRYRYDNAGRLVAEFDGNHPVAEYQYGYRDRVIELVRNDTAVKYHYAADGMVAGKQRARAGTGPRMAHAGFNFFSTPSENHDYSDSAIEPWVWEDAFGAGGAPRGAKALLAKGEESFSNEPHVSGGVPVAGSDRVTEDEKFFVSDYLGNTMMELPGKESTEFDKGRRNSAGFSFLTTAMGADVSGEGALAGAEGNDPAMARFTGKPYDEDLQAYVFPFRNYSAKLARWTSADPAGFPDGPNRHFYAPVPTSGLDPLGLNVLFINNKDAVDGAGHGAVLIGDDTDGYTYHSFGKKSSKSEYSDANGTKFSRDAALDYARREGYDRFLEISTDPSQDQDARDSAEAFKNRSYDFSVENCMQLVNEAVEATGEIHWVSRRHPNYSFDENSQFPIHDNHEL